MTANRNKLAAIVGKRFDLTDAERDELDGSTLAELASHAEHLLARRHHVEAHMRAHPTASESDLVRDYDGRRRPDAASAGRRFASAAIGGHVERDPRTSSFIARAGARRRPIEQDDERRQRVRDRLAAAGFHDQDADATHSRAHDRSM